MKTIFKYKLLLTDVQSVQLPALAEILTVQLQNDEPVLWAKVDTNASPVIRTIEIIGTGNSITGDYELDYISTCQLKNGLVFHFFETIFP